MDALAAAAAQGQADYAFVCGSRLAVANTACRAAGRGGALAWVAALAVGLAMVAAPGRALAQRPMGTDVSHYQGTGINWVNVKNAGVTFAWCKATEATTFKDSTFTLNQTNAKAAGAFVGAYHFARPSRNPNITGANSADSEAAFFWGVVSNYVKTGRSYLVPMLDWEDPNCTNQLSATTLSSWVNEWCNTVSNYARLNGAPGIKPIVYTGTWYSRPSSTYSGLTTAVTIWPGWIAAYPSNPNPQTGGPSDTYPWSKWTVWQYADTNWSGGDSDVFNGTAATLVTTLVIGGSPPVITNQPVGQIVMAGANPSFTVGASGAAPLSYQWRLNGANIPGATTPVLSLANVQLYDAGQYGVIVSNAVGAVASSNAVLTVLMPTGILSAPAYRTDGVFQFNLTGTAGSNYVIEASTNLTDWTPLATNTSPFTFADTNAVNVPLQFYRARLLP